MSVYSCLFVSVFVGFCSIIVYLHVGLSFPNDGNSLFLDVTVQQESVHAILDIQAGLATIHVLCELLFKFSFHCLATSLLECLLLDAIIRLLSFTNTLE